MLAHPGGLILLSLPCAARRILGPRCIVDVSRTEGFVSFVSQPRRIDRYCVGFSAKLARFHSAKDRKCDAKNLARSLRMDQVLEIEHAINHGQIRGRQST